MSTTPVKEEGTSPLRSEVSSGSISSQSNSPDKMDQMMAMLVEMKSDMNDGKF